MKATYFKKSFLPIITGLSVTLISFLRMFLGENDFLTNNIWAEDGLLVVCNLKVNFISCLSDSYSGYLLLYPRLISFIVHYFSAENWALINNLLYFVIIFLLSYLVYSILVEEYSIIVTYLAVITPFTLAITSDQVMNVHSSLYLIVTAYLVIIFSNNAWLSINSQKKYFALALVVFLHASSTPFGLVVAFIIIGKSLLKRKIYGFNKSLIFSIILGNLLQIWIILKADEKRGIVEGNLLVLKNSFNYFLKSSISIFYYPPNSKLESGVFLQQSLVSFLYSHVYVLIIVIFSFAILPLFAKGRQSYKLHSISIVSISLIAILFISSKTFGWPYRFLVLTSTLTLWIFLNLLSFVSFKNLRRILIVLCVITIFYNTSKSFPISTYRSEGPKWTKEINSKTSLCLHQTQEYDLIALTFYPHWPTQNPHAYGLTEPTTNAISCAKLLKKL